MNSTPFNCFKPFGESVRIAASTIQHGNVSICANLVDLCKKHGIEYKKAIKLDYPNGSISMIQLDLGSLAHEVYLNEAAYHLFVECVSGGEL